MGLWLSEKSMLNACLLQTADWAILRLYESSGGNQVDGLPPAPVRLQTILEESASHYFGNFFTKILFFRNSGKFVSQLSLVLFVSILDMTHTIRNILMR